MKRKAFALRIDEELLKEVETWAKEEYRSVNGQIEWILYRALKEANRLHDRTTDG